MKYTIFLRWYIFTYGLLLSYPMILFSYNGTVEKFDLIVAIILLFELSWLGTMKIKKKWFYINEYLSVYPLSWPAVLLYFITGSLGIAILLYCSTHSEATNGTYGIYYRLILVIMTNTVIAVRSIRKTQKYPPNTVKIKIR